MIIIGIIAALLIVDLFLLVRERFYWALTLYIAAIAVAVHKIDGVQEFILSNGIWGIVSAAGVYLAIGGLVSILKWYQRIRKYGVKLKATVEKFNTSYKNPEPKPGVEKTVDEPVAGIPIKTKQTQPKQFTTEELTIARRKALYDKLYSAGLLKDADISLAPSEKVLLDEQLFKDAITPRASCNKERITMWILLWPFVAVTFFVEDFLGNLATWMMELLNGVYSKIARNAVDQNIGEI